MEPKTQKIDDTPYTLKEAKIKLKAAIEDNWDDFVDNYNKDIKKFIEALNYQFEKPIPPELTIELVEDSSEKIYINIEPKNTHPEFY